MKAFRSLQSRAERIRQAEKRIEAIVHADGDVSIAMSALANMLLSAFVWVRLQRATDDAGVVREMHRMAERLTQLANEPTAAAMRDLSKVLADDVVKQ